MKRRKVSKEQVKPSANNEAANKDVIRYVANLWKYGENLQEFDINIQRGISLGIADTNEC